MGGHQGTSNVCFGSSDSQQREGTQEIVLFNLGYQYSLCTLNKEFSDPRGGGHEDPGQVRGLGSDLSATVLVFWQATVFVQWNLKSWRIGPDARDMWECIHLGSHNRFHGWYTDRLDLPTNSSNVLILLHSGVESVQRRWCWLCADIKQESVFRR